VRLRRVLFWCSDCPEPRESEALAGDDGLLPLRSERAGTLAFVDTFRDPVFAEVEDFVDRNRPSGMGAGASGHVVQKLFGLTVDPDTDGSPFVVGGKPTCQGCGSLTRWEITEPPEFVNVDVPHVSHQLWDRMDRSEREALLASALE
jgi:hypothetical protein